MSTILIEDRKDLNSHRVLQAIANTCRSLGHDVFRWRSPHSGRVPHWRHIFRCDLAILFNGTHLIYGPALERLRQMEAKRLYVELGWNPQAGTCQIDPAGINARASWARAPLHVVGQTPLATRPTGNLLVVLQLDTDTQITQQSPWFRSMRQFLDFLCLHSRLPLCVRAHPKSKDVDSLRELALSRGAEWDQSASLAEAFRHSRAVACINSSGGVEALSHGLPVLCYGNAIYRHPGAVYCLDDRPEATRAVIDELAAGQCSLQAERVTAALKRVMDHQWTVAEIPERLPALLQRVLGEKQGRGASTVRRDGLALRLIRDLPSLILPRANAA